MIGDIPKQAAPSTENQAPSSGQQDQRKSPLAIFVHLPKTAGITVANVLRRQYGERSFLNLYRDRDRLLTKYVNLPVKARERYKVARGHVGYGIHETLGESNYLYFTILRDPISRVISHYYFHVNYPLKHQLLLVRRIAEENIDLKTYVSDVLALKDIDNYQTRLLVGEEEGLSADFGTCPPDFLERAKHHLDKEFVAVGVTERFDETLLVLQKILGWKMPLYISKNVGKKRPKDTSIAPDVRNAIAQRNQLDIALYNHANERLDQLIADNFTFFELRLFWFRLLNRLYNSLYEFSRENFSEAMQKELDDKLFGGG